VPLPNRYIRRHKHPIKGIRNYWFQRLPHGVTGLQGRLPPGEGFACICCSRTCLLLVGTTALVGPLLSDRQYQFTKFLVFVSEASMPVSVLFHLNHMLYAVAGDYVYRYMVIVDSRHHHYQYSQFYAAHILHY
jgi:hypothetical protein